MQKLVKILKESKGKKKFTFKFVAKRKFVKLEQVEIERGRIYRYIVLVEKSKTPNSEKPGWRL